MLYYQPRCARVQGFVIRNWAVPNLNDFSIVSDEPVVASESDNEEPVVLNPDVDAVESEVTPKGFKRK